MSWTDARGGVTLLVGASWGLRTFLQTRVVDSLRESLPVSVLASKTIASSLASGSQGLAVAPLPPTDLQRGPLGALHRRLLVHFFRTSTTATRRYTEKRVPAASWRSRLRRRLDALDARLLASQGSVARLRSRVQNELRRGEAYGAARRRLEEARPALVVSTVTYDEDEAVAALAARDLGIPTVAWINSWDNPTSKGPFLLAYDSYAVWSDAVASALRSNYPESAERPVAAVGAPHFDWYRDETLLLERGSWAEGLGLDPELPVVLYAGATPTLAAGEEEVVLHLAQRLSSADRPAQILLRPHPGDRSSRFRQAGLPANVVQAPEHRGARPGDDPLVATDDRVALVNAVRHADVVVNMASTMSLDAAYCDTPVVCVAWDPSPGARRQHEVEAYYSEFEHFASVVESGAVLLGRSIEELVQYVRESIDHPERRRLERRRIARHWCGPLDGASSRRLADHLRGLCSASVPLAAPGGASARPAT